MPRFDRRLRSSGLGVDQVSTWMRQGYVRSIQRATITLNNVVSNTATVNAVNTANAVLRCLSWSDQATAADLRQVLMSVVLTNGTTVTAAVNTGSAANHILSFELIEYWPGIIKSLQRGTITCTTATTATATITSVNTAKAELVWGGYTTTDTTTPITENLLSARIDLTNATTVTVTKENNTGVLTVPFQVVEWF